MEKAELVALEVLGVVDSPKALLEVVEEVARFPKACLVLYLVSS